LIYTFNKTLP